MNSTDRSVRFEVFAFFLEQCHPPTTSDLSARTAIPEATIKQSLENLERLHHLTLYNDDVPSPTPIAMAHPFSHLPTPWVVAQGSKSWWANCAWCAFGLAAMLSPADITVTCLTASHGPCTIKVADGEIADTEAQSRYHATFCAPPSKWWNDVRFACSTIQLCKTREEAESWHRRHGFYEGEVMSLGTLWDLSKAWYHDKHKYEYERKTLEEKEELFQRLGMVSRYWST